MTGGDLFSSYSGVFMVQIICFLAAAFLTRRLDVRGFRSRVQSRFGELIELAVD